MLRQHLERLSANDQEEIELFRVGSVLKLKGHKHPILRICIDSGSQEAPRNIQVGFPALLEGGQINFNLLREWVRTCDNYHDCQPKLETLLPTRVLDVGDHENSDLLRLHCSEEGERGKYIALSHCWGRLKESQKFCTYRCNFSVRLEAIHFDKLPKTFQDAVTVTRELGVRFLWIDSICIIQPHKECSDECRDECRKSSDWAIQSQMMETVFSSAYCTIAASSAIDSTKGFLGLRSPRHFVTAQDALGYPLFIFDNIDDFHRDVDGGKLSNRAWVLQERVLSRRTIHFTSVQAYWECGNGIRCESLIRMHK